MAIFLRSCVLKGCIWARAGIWVHKRKKENRCLAFTFYVKREIRKFHVVVMQRRQRNVQKSVMHVQSCCFANLNLLLFCRSPWRRLRLRYLTVCLSHVPGFFLYISATQIPLSYSPLSLMQVKLPRKLLYERDADATLHPWARRQATYGSSRQGETLCELSSQDRVHWYNSTTSCLLQCVPLWWTE